MSRQVNLGQIVPNIQIGTTTTSNPGTQASVTNVGTALNPILNFSIPKGEPGAIKLLIVNQLPQTGQDDTLYFVPKEDTETSDLYDEYVWINNAWELLGEKQITIDLSDYYTKQETNNLLDDYVKNTDYATTSKGGTIIIDGYYGTTINQGKLRGSTRTYEQYQSGDGLLIISKNTLENVITGKGLVSNTDYATPQKDGLIKAYGTYGAAISTSNAGGIYPQVKTNQQYESSGDNLFISKGTLENVLNARIGDIDTALDLINGEVI